MPEAEARHLGMCVRGFDEELPENPMIVGEAEQLPMLGLEDETALEEEEVEAQGQKRPRGSL